MSEREKYELVLMNHPPGVISGCAKCRKVLRQGTWAVGLIIGDKKYLVGANPLVICCGEEKQVIEAFDSVDEARELSRKIDAILIEEKSTENLVLYQSHVAVSSATH